MSTRTGDFLKGIIVGSALGALLGILYAPKSGKETREDLAQKAEDLMAKAKVEYERAMERSKRVYDEAIKRAEEIEHLARQAAMDAGGKVSELAALGKETFDDKKSRLKKAIDAGVEAFKEEKEKNL
jgi:gas vesicle protein